MGGGRGIASVDDLAAGAVAGAFSRMVIAPLDVLKIRFQVQSETQGLYRYHSIGSAFRKILQEEGITAFWKGNIPAMLMVVPFSGIQFGTFYGLKVSGLFNWQEPTASLVMGGIAGMSATIWTYPLDLLRTRLAAQVEPKMYHGFLDAAKIIHRKEGFRGFFAGISPTLVEIVPYMAFSFAVYETTKEAWMTRLESTELSPLESMTIGGVTGTVSKLAILPLDNVKKRMQVQTQFGMPKYAGVWHALATIAEKDGLKGLFRGAVPSLLKAAPYTGLTFASFEFTKRKLSEVRAIRSTS